MEFGDRPSPNPETILRSDFGQPLLFQPLFDEVITLSPVALEIWRLLDGQHTVTEITAQVQVQYEDAPASLAEDVLAFLNDLKRRGFVSLAPVSARPTPPEEPLRPKMAFDALNPCCVTILKLGDGSHWQLVALDEPAGRVLAQFAASSGLPQTTLPGPNGQSLYLVTDGPALAERVPDGRVLILQAPGVLLPARGPQARGSQRPPPEPASEAKWLWMQLVRLSAFLGEQVQARGGFLVHSALAQTPTGASVLLSGRSGVGKSTASRRLAPPWRSLCDDVTLVVRAAGGDYWAHPWPTWSWVYAQQHDHCWDVQTAVPLQAVFILEQGPVDRAQPMAPPEAISLLMELSHQASRYLWKPVGGGPDLRDIQASNRQRFENVCALVSARPVFLLDVALEGSFWVEIERALL